MNTWKTEAKVKELHALILEGTEDNPSIVILKTAAQEMSSTVTIHF